LRAQRRFSANPLSKKEIFGCQGTKQDGMGRTPQHFRLPRRDREPLASLGFAETQRTKGSSTSSAGLAPTCSMRRV
jgi:predicted ArsR family transcriptional regulator